ncbi:glycine--tRNA ligase [Candidatus Parcubacteria bacterium]|nr:glycine--tRNA ligase [Candidatus Parcubacteria bacterium]
MNKASNLMQEIVSLCKRRGFIFPSSEIYNGFRSCYDFGSLGVELKNNIKQAWWKNIVQNRQDVVGLDASILMSPKVWEASGHLTAGFADELVECKSCHKRFKLDELKENKCPECKGELTKPRKFNLMMKTFVGPVEDKAATTYLRAETCQGIYINFLNVLNSMRMKIPFGIAQIGKSFRNEITPGNFIFRLREFEQMEMQWFCHPPASKTTRNRRETKRETDAKNWEPDDWFNYWKEERMKWYLDFGIKKENLRAVEIPEKDRAHYAKRQIDIEYKFPFGWKEVEGIHDRGDWDLSNHSKYSKKDLSYFNEADKEKYIPHIIETSVGVDRSLFAFLCEAYEEVKGGRTKTTKAVKESEMVLRLDKRLTPIKASIFPLVKNKPEIVKKAKQIFDLLKPNFMCQYDEAGSIGRRYRRADEIGVPFAITIDFDTLKQDDVTIRDRDTMKQERIKIENLVETLKQKLNSE